MSTSREVSPRTGVAPILLAHATRIVTDVAAKALARHEQTARRDEVREAVDRKTEGQLAAAARHAEMAGQAAMTARQAETSAGQAVSHSLALEQQKPAPMLTLPPLDSGVQVINGPDAALNEIASSLRLHAPRAQIHMGGKRLDVSRVESEEDLQHLWESLPHFSKVPAIRDLFLHPAFGLVYEPPQTAMRSRLRIGQTPSQVRELQPLYETHADEVKAVVLADTTRAAAPKLGRRRAYLAVGMQEGHLLYGKQKGEITWGELDHPSLMKVLGLELAKLGKLHAAGWEAGDTSVANTMVSSKLEPYLISIGHLKPLDRRTQGMPEMLSVLTTFAHDLSANDIVELLPRYLDADAGARVRAEEYLKYHHSTSKRTKSKPYAHHTSLEDRLVGRIEDLVDPLPSREYKEAA